MEPRVPMEPRLRRSWWESREGFWAFRPKRAAGRHVVPAGVNFSVYSRSASAVDLVFFDREDDARPSRVVPIVRRRTGLTTTGTYSCPALRPGNFMATGFKDPSIRRAACASIPPRSSWILTAAASRFPRITTVNRRCRKGDNAATAMKSVVVDPDAYDWEGDTPLRRPASQTIIYEMHVRGFTRHPSSGVAEAGARNLRRLDRKDPLSSGTRHHGRRTPAGFSVRRAGCSAAGRMNYWGYAPISFFAPHHAYSSRQDRLGPVNEFRDMVKALHRAGIEVILDVVFNHTAEGNHDGPTLSFRGLENGTYYILERDRSRYANYSGTGNTLNGNNPIVRRMILDSLRYWVEEMHVDGFRFDLASILDRDESGNLLPSPPALWDIDSEPTLASTKLIAEAWDAAGLYQVGNFIGDSWREWNGRFRDDVRSFIRGDEGFVAAAGRPAPRQSADLRPQATRGGGEREFRLLPRRLHA